MGRTGPADLCIPQTADLFGVCYGNGTFIAVGYNNLILFSKDLLSWANVGSGYANLRGVCYGNGIFLSVGYVYRGMVDGVVLSSVDGVSWASEDFYSTGLYGVCYGNGTFAVVGANGMIRTSTEGAIRGNWYGVAYQPYASELHGVCYGKSSFLAVGYNGSIVQYNPLVAMSAATDNSGGKITLVFNEAPSGLPASGSAGFSITLNGTVGDVVTGCTQESGKPTNIDLTLTSPVKYKDTVTLNYAPGALHLPNGQILPAFSMAVVNNVPSPLAVISVVPNMTSPQPVGTTVRWTCTAQRV